jgi:hypothetical protein
MLVADEPIPSGKKKKGAAPSYPKCTLLARLGVDYLGQFSKQYEMDIDFTFCGDDERAAKAIVEVIGKVLVDPKKTDSILSSIAFYLLSIKDKSDNLRVTTNDVLTQLLEMTKLPLDLQWV